MLFTNEQRASVELAFFVLKADFEAGIYFERDTLVKH
jgi:hypothetical protein